MVRASTIAVLRAHLHSLEVMAAQCEELAKRADTLAESRRLDEFSRKFELLALEHRRCLDELNTSLAA
jgi:hypothetical protein